jgi:hypothetical protein
MARLVCTNCRRPTDTLYRVFSNPGSIQLTTCASCGRDVDPYIEREWLLVLMDCVLHRPEAFLHVLYNRAPFCDLRVVAGENEAAPTTTTTGGGGGGGGRGGGRRRRRRLRHVVSVGEDDDPKKEKDDGGRRRDCRDLPTTTATSFDGASGRSFGRFARYSVAASALRACLRRGAAGGGGSGGSGDELARELVVSLAHAIAEEAVFVSGTILASSFLVVERGSSSVSNDDAPTTAASAGWWVAVSSYEVSSPEAAFFYSRLYLALTMPAFFHVATIFALIWEDSYAVRLLGAMFVLSLQRVAVSAVVEEERRNGSGSGNGGGAARSDSNRRLGGGDAAADDRARRSATTGRRGSARGGRLLPRSLPLVVGLVLRALFVRKWMGPMIDGPDHACTGIALSRSILFGMDSFCIE